MKTVASYFWKTLAVLFFALGLSVVFSSSASADDIVSQGNVDDQADNTYLEYLLQSDNSVGEHELTPEEQNAKDEADAAALAKALEGFEDRKATLTNEIYNHLEFDGGIKSWHKGVIYFSTTEAGYEFYSTKYKSMIDEGYLVLDATFDMVLLSDESSWAGDDSLEKNFTEGIRDAYLATIYGNGDSQVSTVDSSFVRLSGEPSGCVRAGANLRGELYLLRSPAFDQIAVQVMFKDSIEQWNFNVPSDSGGLWFSNRSRRRMLAGRS